MTGEEAQRGGRSGVTTWVSGTALVLSVVAVAVSVSALMKPQPPPVPAGGDYDRVVAELWEVLKPVYDDFGLAAVSDTPATIGEAIGPLVRTWDILRPEDDSEEGAR